MILSNNPRTYILITIYHKDIHKKYTYRWSGPSAVPTLELRSALWDIRNLRRVYDLK